MGASVSFDDLDAIMEAAEAIVSSKRSKAMSASVSKKKGSIESSELAQAKPAGDVLDRPDEPGEALGNRNVEGPNDKTEMSPERGFWFRLAATRMDDSR